MAIKGKKKYSFWLDPEAFRKVQQELYTTRGYGGMSQFVNNVLIAAGESIDEGLWREDRDELDPDYLAEMILREGRPL